MNNKKHLIIMLARSTGRTQQLKQQIKDYLIANPGAKVEIVRYDEPKPIRGGRIGYPKLPAPEYDENGDLWGFDPEFGWENWTKKSKEFTKIRTMSSTKIEGLGKIFLTGTGSFFPTKEDIKNIFYSPKNEDNSI